MIDPKLTITIPTYNRPTQIQHQVRSLLPQLRPGVEILIRDNASEIPVQSLFSEEELSKITIKRNTTNIGPDANIAGCLYDVNQGWVWLLGDDDILSDDAVDIILRTIHEHQDCCYINFDAKKEEETTGLEETLTHLSIKGAFGVAFFMSDCIFNIDRLKSSLYWYYVFLSSQTGQIYFVIKHLEAHSGEKCFFSSQKYIKEVPHGDWSPLNLIVNNSIAIDKFHYAKQSMKGTLFKALVDMYLSLLIENKDGFRKQWYYLNYIRKKIGTINLIRYNSQLLLGYFAKKILPAGVFMNIRNNIAGKYNKKIIGK